MRVCSTPGCPTIHPGTGRCPTCRNTANRARLKARGNPYNNPGHQTFRTLILTRDPICTLCHTRRSTVADHHPLEREELIAQGLDPNDPRHGRGLCTPCHNAKSARNAARDRQGTV